MAATRRPGRCGRSAVEDLPIPGGVLDVAVAVTVLEFVYNPAAAMTELAWVTRPGTVTGAGSDGPKSFGEPSHGPATGHGRTLTMTW
jgi:hypothetical protein